MFEVTEVSIAELRAALEAGRTTAVELVEAYLARIDAYDGADTTTQLNAVVVRNPDALKEAEASDARRARGEPLSPLDGIPYTAKDSYLVKGLTAASGSPAFKDLVAQRDAFTVERLRAAGAICLGKTNMPPMANGGMQRGVYGRAESPYNANYLTAPFASGSSNGAGTATAASFSAFGLAEETWSSGRGPASNNGLCAYTPSRGDLGAWQLAADPDHGRGRTLRPHHGGFAGDPRSCRGGRSGHPWRSVAPAALGADPESVRRASRLLPRADRTG